MKIKSIAALCKKVRHAVIMDSASADGSIVQFIGDGNAAYICDGLPTVEEESLLAIFDVPQEQRITWHVKRSNVYDMLLTSNDMPLYESRVHITYGGKELIPLYTHTRRIVFIDAKYLAPLADNPTMELYLRNANSTPVVAAKTGFIDLAIISIYKAKDKAMAEELKRIAAYVQYTVSIADDGSESGQCSIELEQETED